MTLFSCYESRSLENSCSALAVPFSVFVIPALVISPSVICTLSLSKTIFCNDRIDMSGSRTGLAPVACRGVLSIDVACVCVCSPQLLPTPSLPHLFSLPAVSTLYVFTAFQVSSLGSLHGPSAPVSGRKGRMRSETGMEAPLGRAPLFSFLVFCRVTSKQVFVEN